MKLAIAVVFVALIASSGRAQSQPPAIKATAAGVLIDVSVLDSKGRPVLDLAAGDFELSEDGKRQQLVSVTLVKGGVATPVPPTAPRTNPESGQPVTPAAAAAIPQTKLAPTVTAILFDRLSPEARPRARGAPRADLSKLNTPAD
jgi:hypothetical protein